MALTRDDISIIKMLLHPPQKIVNDGYRIISIPDGHIYEFETDLIKWIDKGEATRQNYKEGLSQI